MRDAAVKEAAVKESAVKEATVKEVREAAGMREAAVSFGSNDSKQKELAAAAHSAACSRWRRRRLEATMDGWTSYVECSVAGKQSEQKARQWQRSCTKRRTLLSWVTWHQGCLYCLLHQRLQ